MANTTDNIDELDEGHKNSENNSNEAHNSQPFTTVSEPEQISGTNIASDSNNQEEATVSNTPADPPTPSNSEQSQKKAKKNVDVDDEVEETKQTDTSISSSDTTKKNEEPSSSEHKQKKTHKLKSASTVDKFGRPSDLNIGYSVEEEDLLESVLDKSTNKELVKRLFGCVYGQALGDAYGLSTEFEDRDRVKRNYPNSSELIPFPDYTLTGHNRRWPRGDWTDDTDQWILILQTLTDHDGDIKVFADKLTNWIRYGYPELGDHGGMGLGANVSQVVRSHNYTKDPFRASEEVWKRSNCQAAPNGAVMRCSASAFVHFNDREKVISTTIAMCKTTHFDPRCIASCLAVCLAVTYLLNEDFNDNDIESLIKRVQDETIKIVGDNFSKDDREMFIWHTEPRTLEELYLDEPNSIGYTYKCLASGFYGLRSTRSFKETLNDLIRYGGDADTNGAVCGTLYGARHGYRALPYEWLNEMPNKKWLDLIIIDCIKKKNLIENNVMETN